MIIFREVAQMMEQMNYATNFILYVLCGRNFRKRVKLILCKKCSLDDSGVSQEGTLTGGTAPQANEEVL